MKEIKSVRVRRRDLNSGTLDIKVTIYEERRTFGADERILVGFNNDRPVWIATTYRKKDIYKEFTDDQFIDDFIILNSKIDGGGKTYDIIQDPWENKVPKWRSYGYDPYYLNNGAQIFISWTEGNFTAGGLTYSDDSGKEINGNVSISKTVFNIIGIDEPSVLQYGKSQEIEYKSFDIPTQVYGGLFDDLSIIREVIAAWKRKVPNYELALCSPDNEKCSIIPYKSPLKPPEPEVPPTIKVATNEAPKEKMTVVLPPDVVKVKSDITSFVVYVGKGKEKGLLENPSTEEDEFIFDDSSGIDEYTEDEFIGEEENSISMAEELELPEVVEINKKAEEEAVALGPLTVVPGENPFSNAKKGTTNPSENGIGYPANASTQKFVKKHTNDIYPAKMHPDGTFVISDGKKLSKLTSRHWLTPNPEYVRRLSKVKVPMASGDKTIEVHPEFAAKLEAAFKVIIAKGLSKYIVSSAGGLAVRNVTNGIRLSNHSYGFAMDVNTLMDGWQYGDKWDVANKTIKSGGKTRTWNTFDTGFYEVVKVMKAAGIGWLGSSDPMHFSIHE